VNELCSKIEHSEQAGEACTPSYLGEACQPDYLSQQDYLAADRHFQNGELPDYFDGQDVLRQVDRRTKPATRKTFEVSKIWESHEEIIRRLLLGQKATSIAADLGVTPAMVGYVRNSQVVKDKLETMRAARDADTVDIAKEIREKAPIALKLLEKVIAGDIDAPITTRAREANNWLDRAGFSPVRNIHTQNVSAHFTAEEINEIKRQAVENGFARKSVLNEHLINVTPEA